MVNINTTSIYHPTGVNQQERSEFLNKIDELVYNSLDREDPRQRREDEILVTGCDINNASIGNRDSVYCHPDSTEETQNLNVVGPHGIKGITIKQRDTVAQWMLKVMDFYGPNK
eukprot:scaffold17117_cov52-Attheya_sp.AAC.8